MRPLGKLSIRETIVVEGRYDKNTVSQVVDAPVIELGGFGVFNDTQKLALLRRMAKERGIVIFTDPDGAGFVIRNYLKGAIAEGRVLHAYVPDIAGKEKRKKTAGKEGKLGVEGMSPAVIEAALRRAGATFSDGNALPSADTLSKADLLELGLVGAGSVSRRAELLQTMQLPARMSANALLEVLRALGITARELAEMVKNRG